MSGTGRRGPARAPRPCAQSFLVIDRRSVAPGDFAKGGAKVGLEEESPDATILQGETDAQIGGKLARPVSRLIDSKSRKLAASFLENRVALVAPS